MKLTKLQLENFRNYGSLSYEFDPKNNLTIFVGNNGLGKTNFLEAVHLLSLGHSFRTRERDDMVLWEKDYFRCMATVEDKNSRNVELEVSYSSSPIKQKKFKRNGGELKSLDYFGSITTVLFHPEDLNMLYLTPSLRRRYLDMIISQSSKKYLQATLKYRQVLRQRNALLAIIRKAKFEKLPLDHLMADLDAWDKELVDFGASIIEAREKYVEFLQQNLEGIYSSIADEKAKVEVEYESSVLDHMKKNPSSAEDVAATQISLLNLRRESDIRKTQTTIGPHRDDLLFFIDGKNICRFASRGEFRTLLLAIKLAEIKFLEEETGHKPILLLDDVFSELDRKRQKHLLKTIKGYQTIITTTEIDDELATFDGAHVNYM